MTDLIQSLNISSSRYINALISLAAFGLIAAFLDLLVNKVLRRFVNFTKTDLDDRILDVVHKPLFYSIVTFGLLVSIIDLKPSEKVLFYSQGILYTVLVAIAGFVIIRTGNALIEHFISNVKDVTGLGKDITPLVENVLIILVVIVAAFAALSIWQVNVTPLLASAGIAGILVALAAKDTVGNFFGGISIFVDKPFKIGDYIVLDGNERGEVVSIGIRSTRIKTRDDVLITIPNSIIANTKIVNESAPAPKFRVRIPVGVAYGSDIDLIEKILLEIASSNPNVVGDPAPRVRFREFGDSALKFELLCWAHEPALRGLTVHEINCAIYKRFNEAGIRIPFPQRDVYVYKNNVPEK